ncbi:derepression protein [Salmonella enterica]|nr:derepression protein [Salmonella enterica]EIZ2335992.1 derepression protein [Salmonella enterica]
MANRKTRRDSADRLHIQTEINRRLYRAEKLAKCLYFESISDNSVLVELCISSVLSYLADDLQDIHDLVNGKKHTV